MDNKRIYYLVGGALVILILIIVLISCRRETTPKEITLTFWNLTDEKTAFEKVINDFQTANPNTKIEYVKKDSKGYLNTVLQEIAAGKGPDILAVPNDWLPKYHSMLMAMPEGKLADKKLKKDDSAVYQDTYPQIVVQDNIIDQKIFGAPLSMDILKLYLNQNILDEAFSEYRQTNPEIDDNLRKIFLDGPRNWDEFSRLTQITTQKSNSKIIRSAAALGTSDNINHSVDILTVLMLQNGAKMTNDQKTLALFQTQENAFGEKDFPGKEALEFYASFADPFSPNFTWDASMSEAVRAFAEGKTALLIGYEVDQAEIKRINPDLSYSTVALPQVKETTNPLYFGSYTTYSVSRTSSNSNLAWDFILAMTGRDNAMEYKTQTKNTLARKELLETDSPLLKAANWSKPDPEKADEIFNQMISAVNSGVSAQTALEAAASQITNLLEDLK